MTGTGRVLLASVVCALAMAGCAPMGKVTRLQFDLADAGYETTAVDHRTSDGVAVLSVEGYLPRGPATEDDLGQVAEIVWTTFPGDVDELRVLLAGTAQVTMSDDELAARFGPRPDELPTGDGEVDVAALAVILVSAAALTGIFVLVWRRGLRPVTHQR
jgi:hypothetical protein